MRIRSLASKSLLMALLGVLPAAAQKGAVNAPTQQDVDKALSKKQFADVKGVLTADGSVTLTGQVKLLSDKLDAEHRIQKMHADVNDQIEVNGPTVPDQELYLKLAKQLAYDRQGYGTLPFNVVDVAVKNGVVAVRGLVVLPVDKDSALGIITNTPGVRVLEDHLQVAPPSPNDDRIRRAEFTAIYGYNQFTRYAINPVKPIRISVLNGHVTLLGSVDTKTDADVAGLRANGVSGVFSVENHLQYGSGGNESVK